MKKVIYVLILPLVVAGGVVLANREVKNENAERPGPKARCVAKPNAELSNWEASPDGIRFNEWKASPEGKKVLAGAAKAEKHIHDSSNMEAVVTALCLPPESRLGFGVMASIEGVDYILNFDPDESQLEQLQGLKVNDKIIIKSQSVSFAPKYAYPILRGDYVERDGKVIYKRTDRKGGC